MPVEQDTQRGTERGTVIHISSTPWHFTWQSTHIITQQFARRGWQVIFLDPIPKRIPRLREFGRVVGRLRNHRAQAGIFQQPDVPGVTYLLPKALPDRGALARRVNRHLFLPALARQIQRHAGNRPHLAFVSLASYAALDLLDLLQPDQVVYGCYLDVANDPLAPADMPASERALVARANLVLVDDGLANRERITALEPRCPVIDTAKTVSYAAFAPARRLRTITPSEPPVCCYFGDLRSNVDVDLLRKVSFRYRLRLIASTSVALDGFSPQTVFIPPMPYPDLPASLGEVDIFLLPYRRDDPYNRAVAPAKTYECLATGKPTIAIGLPSLAPLAGLIDLVDDDAAFMAAIDRAAAEVTHPDAPDSRARREARLQKARAHDEQVEFDRWFAQLDQLLAST